MIWIVIELAAFLVIVVLPIVLWMTVLNRLAVRKQAARERELLAATRDEVAR